MATVLYYRSTKAEQIENEAYLERGTSQHPTAFPNDHTKLQFI